MLDLRLNTLNDHVDEFIIAEATRDHAGNEKKLNFDYKNFLKFKNKIRSIERGGCQEQIETCLLNRNSREL